MAEKRRFLDVWIVESKTVYREVPFTVVADWVQQGRLLEDDMLRPSGTADWHKVGSANEFTPYLPRAEADRVEDRAEALEAVELDFRWKKRIEDEDDDVDMIPLIDVSLVLLIFFMLTASGAGVATLVPTPQAEYGTLSPDTKEIQLNINLVGDSVPVYSLSVGNHILDGKDANLQTIDELLQRLSVRLAQARQRVDVTINAHPDVPSGRVRELMAKLESPPFRQQIDKKYWGVSDK